MDYDEQAKNNEEINGGRGKMGEVSFGEYLTASGHKNNTYDSDAEKWNEGDAEVVKFVEYKARNIAKNIGKWYVVKGGSGGRIGVMIDARACEPADEKASDSANKA